MGEFDDKATQSEISELEGTLQNGSRNDNSLLKELLDKLPSGLFGGDDKASKADELQANATAAQMQNLHVSPKEPEAFTRQLDEIVGQIKPVMQFHDELMQQISEAIEKIPVLPELIEQFQEQLSIFVFSLIAPFVVPIISQMKNELNEGSSEIIQSSLDKQHIVFNDDNSSDPTHSMLSKDHFSNILNEPAGKIASQVLKWAVPQLIQAWDDERVDADRTINRIINGVFHHPALRQHGDDGASDGRQLMFQVVQQWWGEKDSQEQDEFRGKLSRDGVEQGLNHKEGVHDSGHGSCKPLGMPKSQVGSGIAGGAAGAIMSELGSVLEGGSGGNHGGSSSGGNKFSQMAAEAVGGGALGGIVGGIAGGLLSGFGKKEKDSFSNEGYTQDGGYQQSYTEVAHHGNQYGQAQFSETQLPGGGERFDYQHYEQQGQSQGQTQGYGYEARQEIKPTQGGGYTETEERIYQRPGGEVETERWSEGRTADGQHYHEARHHKEYKSDSDSDSDSSKKHRKHHKKHHGHGSDDDRPQQYEPPREEYGGNYGEPPRQEFGGGPPREEYGGRERYEEPPRQEFGGGYGGRGGYEEPPREEFGGGFGGRGGYGEPPRQEFGGGYGGRGGFEEPPREEFGGRGGFGGEEYGGGRQEFNRGEFDEGRREFEPEEERFDEEERERERRRW
jgi:hypothetical protein